MLSDPSRWGENGVFDPATAIGLHNHHRVLIFGNSAFLPWLVRENNNVVSAKKISEITRALDDHGYDRVIVGREQEIPTQLMLAQAYVALRKSHGVLVVFPTNEADAWELKTNVEFFYPGSKVWETNTSFGHCIQIELGAWHAQ